MQLIWLTRPTCCLVNLRGVSKSEGRWVQRPCETLRPSRRQDEMMEGLVHEDSMGCPVEIKETYCGRNVDLDIVYDDPRHLSHEHNFIFCWSCTMLGQAYFCSFLIIKMELQIKCIKFSPTLPNPIGRITEMKYSIRDSVPWLKGFWDTNSLLISKKEFLRSILIPTQSGLSNVNLSMSCYRFLYFVLL